MRDTSTAQGKKTSPEGDAPAPARRASRKPWLRLYREALNLPKIIRLNDRQFRAWINILMVADDDGMLPALPDVAVYLRVTVTDALQLVTELVESGLIDPIRAGENFVYRVHDWEKHQRAGESDSAARVRKHREKKRLEEHAKAERKEKRYSNGYSNRYAGSGNAPESESESDKENNSPNPLNTPAPSQAQGRAKARELGIDLGFAKGGRGEGRLEALAKRAEGYGLPFAEFVETAQRNGARNPEGYIRTLCVNRLKAQLPAVREEVLLAALNGTSREAHTAVTIALMAGAAS